MATCTRRAEASIGDTVWRMACHVRHVKWVPGKQQAGCSRPKLTDRPGRPRTRSSIPPTRKESGRKGSDPSVRSAVRCNRGRRPSVSTTGHSVAVSLSRPLSCLPGIRISTSRRDLVPLNIPHRLVHVSTPYAVAVATATPPTGCRTR
jgi:hypothetical protein